MNIKRIEVGQIYKNYKSLCEALEQKPKAGNSKKSQIKEWERFFNYKKEGHAFVITEIYSAPTPKVDNRNGGNNVALYITHTEHLIIDWLASLQDEGRLYISRNAFLKGLKMINENYAYGRRKPNKLSSFMKITKNQIMDFYDTTDRMLERNLEKALESLTKQFLITWNKSLTVCHVDSGLEVNEMNEVVTSIHADEESEGEELYTVQQKDIVVTHREATPTEQDLIRDVQRSVLLELGLQNERDIFVHRKEKEFYEKVKREVHKRSNIAYFYYSYDISFNEDYVKQQAVNILNLQLEKELKQKEQQLLNNAIMERLNTNGVKRFEKATDEEYISKIKNKSLLNVRSNKDYLNNHNKLIDTLINSKAEDIRNDIKQVKI